MVNKLPLALLDELLPLLKPLEVVAVLWTSSHAAISHRDFDQVAYGVMPYELSEALDVLARYRVLVRAEADTDRPAYDQEVYKLNKRGTVDRAGLVHRLERNNRAWASI